MAARWALALGVPVARKLSQYQRCHTTAVYAAAASRSRWDCHSHLLLPTHPSSTPRRAQHRRERNQTASTPSTQARRALHSAVPQRYEAAAREACQCTPRGRQWSRRHALRMTWRECFRLPFRVLFEQGRVLLMHMVASVEKWGSGNLLATRIVQV